MLGQLKKWTSRPRQRYAAFPSPIKICSRDNDNILHVDELGRDIAESPVGKVKDCWVFAGSLRYYPFPPPPTSSTSPTTPRVLEQNDTPKSSDDKQNRRCDAFDPSSPKVRQRYAAVPAPVKLFSSEDEIILQVDELVRDILEPPVYGDKNGQFTRSLQCNYRAPVPTSRGGFVSNNNTKSLNDERNRKRRRDTFNPWPLPEISDTVLIDIEEIIEEFEITREKKKRKKNEQPPKTTTGLADNADVNKEEEARVDEYTSLSCGLSCSFLEDCRNFAQGDQASVPSIQDDLDDEWCTPKKNGKETCVSPSSDSSCSSLEDSQNFAHENQAPVPSIQDDLDGEWCTPKKKGRREENVPCPNVKRILGLDIANPHYLRILLGPGPGIVHSRDQSNDKNYVFGKSVMRRIGQNTQKYKAAESKFFVLLKQQFCRLLKKLVGHPPELKWKEDWGETNLDCNSKQLKELCHTVLAMYKDDNNIPLDQEGRFDLDQDYAQKMKAALDSSIFYREKNVEIYGEHSDDGHEGWIRVMKDLRAILF